MATQEWNLGPYDGREALSALRKSIVLADVSGAIYWANVVLEHGGQAAPRTVSKQLWICAAEIVDDPIIVLRAHAAYQMVQTVSETDHLFYLVAEMCRAPKWWETEEGREVDRAWSAAIGDLKDETRRREIPEYALDRHTRRGWEVKAEKGWWDDRFSGTDLGRQKTSYMFQRDGLLDADSRVECDRQGVEDRGFWGTWRERRRLQGDDLPDAPPDHEPEAVSLFDEGEEVEES